MRIHLMDQLRESVRNTIKTKNGIVIENDLSKILKSGTTAFAMKYNNNNGVLIAADTRAVAGNDIVSHNCNKIQLVPPFSAITYAGTLSIIQFTVELFAKNLKTMELAIQKDIFLTSQANLLKTIIREINFGFEKDFFFNDFIIGGYDIEKKSVLIYYADSLGGLYEGNFFAVGSGGRDKALPVLEDYWRKNLTASEAITLAIKALKKSGYKDPFSDPPELYKPNMYLITANGTGEVNPLDIKKSLKKLRRKNG